MHTSTSVILTSLLLGALLVNSQGAKDNSTNPVQATAAEAFLTNPVHKQKSRSPHRGSGRREVSYQNQTHFPLV